MHERVLHLIDDAGDLRRLPGQERCPGRRAHGRGDVVVLEGDAVAGDRIDPRKRITRRRGPPVGQLVDDHENDVVGRLADAVAARPLILGLHIGRSDDRQQAGARQQLQAAVAEFMCHVRCPPCRVVGLRAFRTLCFCSHFERIDFVRLCENGRRRRSGSCGVHGTVFQQPRCNWKACRFRAAKAVGLTVPATLLTER